MASEARIFSPVVDGSLLLEHGAVRKARKPAADEAVGVLTYPIIDAEGDYVEPDTGVWDDVPVLKADWLHDIPVGRMTVEMMEAVIDGEKYSLPVGTTRFFNSAADFDGFDLRKPDRLGSPTSKSWSRDECLHAAAQAKPLVLTGHARGMSIEFVPNPARTSIIGKSLLRGRPAYRYGGYSGRGGAHTPNGFQVNAGAQQVEKSLEIARTGRHNGEKLLPVILKAFTPLLSAHPRPASVTSGFVGKSMAPDDPTAVVDQPPAVPEVEAESDVPPEATDGMDAAQMVADVAEKLSKRAGKTLHKQTKKFYAKLAEKWEQDVEDLLAHVENVEAEAGGGAGEPDDDPEEGAEGEASPEGEDADPEKKKSLYDADGWPVNHGKKLERDAAGALVLKSHYVPPLRLKDMKPVGKAALLADPDLEAALAGAVEKLRQTARPAQPARRRTNR